MDPNVTAAARHFDAQEAAAENACYTAAAKNGTDRDNAELCDDGDCCCPECPWKETAGKWRKLRPLLFSMGS